MIITLTSGSMEEIVEVADDHLISHFRPDESFPVEIWGDDRIAQAIQQPIGAAAIKDRVFRDSRVAIVVDDATRPTPTKRILSILLQILREIGVGRDNISITIGTGLHRKTTSTEKQRILGDKTLELFDVEDNDARDPSRHYCAGALDDGAPVFLNRRIQNRDLVLTIGMVKSHAFAGFTGGAKSIMPGVSDQRTIHRNHSFRNVEYPRGLIGSCEKSLPRQQMESAAKLVDPFIINVVLNGRGDVVHAVAGDVIQAHRNAVTFYRRSAHRHTKETADIALVFGGHAGTLSLYHALYGCNVVRSTESPILADTGTIILFAACEEGIGTTLFDEIFDRLSNPEEILRHLLENPVVDDQWAVQFLATFLRDINISIVSRGLRNRGGSLFGIQHFESVRSALDAAIQRHGPDYRLAIIENPDVLIINKE